MIDSELLEILACPLCKTEIRLEDDKIVCTKCGRRYPIKDDIPVMLIDEAELPEDTGLPTDAEHARKDSE